VVTKEQFLTNGEKIVFRTKTHIINLIIPAIVLLASFIFLYDSFWLFLKLSFKPATLQGPSDA